MASASGDQSSLHLEELSNQFLICPLCLDQYNTPKVLPCQHTFCLECIRSYVSVLGLGATIPCPLCKEPTHIPRNDVSNLKSNFMIVSLLQFVEKSAKAETSTESSADILGGVDIGSLSEGGCGACGEMASMSSFCQLCQLWLCVICTKAHARLPATSSHQLLSSQQVDVRCKAMVGKGEHALNEIQTSNNELYEALVSQQGQLPENIRLVQEKIETATAQALRVIRDKSKDLSTQAEQFFQEQSEILMQRSRDVLKTKGELDGIEELLRSVKLTEDGFKNQRAIKKVEEYLSKASCPDLSEELSASLSLVYSTFSNSLTDLKNFEIGQVRVVSSNPKKVFLTDRSINIHKIASLVERDYVSALAINKFADKYVVANNQDVMVFKPDSRIPKTFLSPLSDANITKPWGIAYSEEDRRIYISQSGVHEGDGSIVAYTHDGHFHSQVASGLTLPRGVAIHRSYLFVCDQIDKCVYIITTSGRIIRVLKKTPDGKFLFNGPMFVSVGKNGTIVVSDNCTSVKVFDKDCNLKYTYVSNLPESQFWDVHVMQNGTIVVCDWKHGLHKISTDFTNNGVITTETDILREPSALTALESGNSLYIGTCGGEIYSAI